MDVKIINRFLKSILLMLSILNFNINYSMIKTNRLDDIKTKVMKNIEEKLKELGLENIPSSNHLNLILFFLLHPHPHFPSIILLFPNFIHLHSPPLKYYLLHYLFILILISFMIIFLIFMPI